MNQVSENPFPYSDTNKRYHTISWALKQQYGVKTAKIPLNAGFSCPNRDGTKSTGGCRFCSAAGSGDTIVGFSSSLKEQYQANLERARKKWPGALAIPYFQAYSNTYAPLETLRRIYQPFMDDPNIPALAIATRTDCLTEETAAWLAQSGKEIWIELGIQTIHSVTADAMNLCHTVEDAQNALDLCRRYHLKTCLHLINGLPGETREMMMQTASWIARQHPDAVKIHMLHLLDDSALGQDYLKSPFDLMDVDSYVSLVCDQLEILPPDVIIERVSGDGIDAHLIGPDWTRRKTDVANRIDSELYRCDSWQGKYWFPFDDHPRLIEAFEIDGLRAELTASLPYEAMRLRADVFLKEQGFTMEFDEEDAVCSHLVLFKDQQPLACARLSEDKGGAWRIGRVVTAKSARHLHVGTALMKAAQTFIRSRGGTSILLHAQCRVIPFYQKAGFEPYGPQDYDEHVLHQWMKKELTVQNDDSGQ